MIVLLITYKGWIPRKDEDFFGWAKIYVTVTEFDIVPLLDDTDELEKDLDELKENRDNFVAAFIAGRKSNLRTTVQVGVKTEMRAILEKNIRKFQAKWVRDEEKISNELRIKQGTPLYKKTKSPLGTPDTCPFTGKILSPEHQMVFFEIRNLSLPNNKKWGCSYVEFWGLSVPAGSQQPNPEDFLFIDIFTKCTVRYTLPESYQNKTLYFRLRFVNIPNKKGPWSDVYSVIIT